MRQKLAFVLGLLLGAAIVRLLTRRRSIRGRFVDPRTEELRRKLADRRQGSVETPPPEPSLAPTALEPGGVSGAESALPTADIEGTRERVYEQAREAVEEMRRSGESPPDSPSE